MIRRDPELTWKYLIQIARAALVHATTGATK